MKAKILTGLIGGVVVILGVYYFYNYVQQGPEQLASNNEIKITDKEKAVEDTQSKIAQSEQGNGLEENLNNSSSETMQSAAISHFSDETDIEGVNNEVIEVTYDGSKFIPSSLSVKVGTMVVFKNSSKKSFWPASDPHPTHSLYPEFDAKKNIEPGKSYQFIFTKTGNWKYHDHLNTDATGVVNVSE